MMNVSNDDTDTCRSDEAVMRTISRLSKRPCSEGRIIRALRAMHDSDLHDGSGHVGLFGGNLIDHVSDKAPGIEALGGRA